jgi:tetratricopeptide (TPR) repeat protein
LRNWGYKNVKAGLPINNPAEVTKVANENALNFCNLIYRYNKFALLFWTILILFLFFITDKYSVIFSAEVTNKPVLSAAQLQLIERANLLAEKITKPDDRLSKLFELLAFESQFDDKQHAQKTIALILKQISAMEAGVVKNNFYQLLALAQSNIGDYKQINVTLNNLIQSIEKSQIQFDIAEKILYEKEDAKLPIPDEVTDLLRLAYAGAEVAKDTGLEAIAAMQLGRVLAKAGKIKEAKNFINIALEKSDKLAENESKSIKQSLLRIMIQNKIYKEVTDEIAKTKSQETKDIFMGLVLQTLAEEGQINDAKNGLTGIKSIQIRDAVTVGICHELVKKGTTVAELIDLSTLMSSDKLKEIFVQNAISFLLENKRPDIATQLIDQIGAKTESREQYNLILIANMIDEKQFDKALQKISTISDENYKMRMSRYLIISQIRANGLKSVEKIALNYTDAERQQIAALNAETNKLAAIENNSERAKAAFSLLLKQTEILNPSGIQAVTQIVLNEVDKLSSAAQILEYQYNTARLHFELGNFDGVREALNRSVKYLDGVKDLMLLKELVLIDQDGATSTNNVTINKTNSDNNNASSIATPPKTTEVNEAMIRERLFLTYTSICAMYIDINDIDVAEKIYEKSKQYLAATDDDPIRQFDQTGILSKLLLQLDSAGTIKGN